MSQPEVSVAITPRTRPELVRQPQCEGGEGEALLSEVEAALSTLRTLLRHQELFDETSLSDLRQTLESVERRLAREDLQVVVVGERQSGKSTLLDAIVGDRLLGGARRQIAAVTFLRRRDVQSYRARFSTGEVEDFSERFPDRTPHFVAAIEAFEAAVASGKEACASARTELRQAMKASADAESELERELCALDAWRSAAQAAALALVDKRAQAAKLELGLAEAQSRIPRLVRDRPPRFAWWLWLLHAMFVLFKHEAWQHYIARRRACEAMTDNLLADTSEASRAEHVCCSLEAAVEAARAQAQLARARVTAAEQALLRAETQRDGAREKLADSRSEREHHESERKRRFFAELEALSGQRGRERGLLELVIDYPARLLPADVTIIDLPTDSSDSGDWRVVREADGCILLSELDRGVSESSKRLLRELREIVPHLLLVLTKMDQAHRDATLRGARDAWEQVEHARRIGTRRFARELGRGKDTVLSIAVAAEVALTDRDSELGQAFEAELAKLFQLLRHERALILGAHAAAATRRCIAGVSEAEQWATRSCRQRIDELERQRTPEPSVFCERQLLLAGPALETSAHEAIGVAITAVQTGFALLGKLSEQSVDQCRRRRDLPSTIERLIEELAQRSEEIRMGAHAQLEAAIESAVDAAAASIFEELRQNYHLLHTLDHSTTSLPRLDAPSTRPVPDYSAAVVAVQSSLKSFEQARYVLAATGMVSGAAAGALVHPAFGSAAGGVFGALLALAKREHGLRQQTLGALRAALARQEQLYLEELREREQSVAAALRGAVSRSLDHTLTRFRRYLAEPIEAEQQAIDAERQKLSELERLQGSLALHDANLERLQKSATDASLGLCR